MKPKDVFKQAHSFVVTTRHQLCAVCERPEVYHTHRFVKGENGEPDRRVPIQEASK